MTAETNHPVPLFNFPVMLILTAILCLVSYQVFGLNTTLGVATACVTLTWCTWRRKPATHISEAN